MSVRSVKRERFINVITAMAALKIKDSGIGEGYQSHSRPVVGKKQASLPLQMCQGGLKENDRAVNQLLAIVRSENTIGQDKK